MPISDFNEQNLSQVKRGERELENEKVVDLKAQRSQLHQRIEKRYSNKNCAQMFVAPLFPIATKWKRPRWILIAVNG